MEKVQILSLKKRKKRRIRKNNKYHQNGGGWLKKYQVLKDLEFQLNQLMAVMLEGNK